MNRLNTLLHNAGLDLRRTRLVRHKDTRPKAVRQPYDLWKADRERFELYQRIQRRESFQNTDWLVSFVVTPQGETLFVGVYRLLGVGAAPSGTIDPVGDHDVTGYFFYDLKLDDVLKDHAGRIVVDWGPGYRTWVQRADRRDKPIIEIRHQMTEIRD